METARSRSETARGIDTMKAEERQPEQDVTEMTLSEALERLRQVAKNLPREWCECDRLGRRRCGQCH